MLLTAHALQRAQKKVPFQSSMLFFGPESARPSLQQDEDAAGESETGLNQQAFSPKSSSARKHARESGPNGVVDQAVLPTPKRSRKTATIGPERHDEQQQQQQQQPQQTQEGIVDEKVNMDIDEHHDGLANSASSESVPPVPEAKSPSPSDLDQDTDMDMGVSNGVATQGFEVGNGAFPGAGIGVFEPQDQQRMNHLPAPVIPTLDTGQSVGLQFAPAKIADSEDLILPESIVLHVADEAHVTSASWRPTDSTVLAASGHDFAGVWKLPSQPSRPGAVLPPFQDVIDKRDDAMVSAMAWEPGGTMLAIAVFDNHTAGAIRIYDGQEAVLIESLPAAQRLITTLRWQKVGSRLMGFAASPEESSLVLWDLSGSSPLAGAFSITVPEQVNDINWASHGNTSVVCVAGDGVVYQCRAVPDLVIEHKWSSDQEDHTSWSLVRCSWWSEEAAIIVAASASPASLWIPAKNLYARDIHHALLTCLELRPGQMVYPDQDPHCDFATSSLDGTVKIWRYNDHASTIECLFKLAMAESPPILGLAYTPDSNAIAAASYDKVTIWNAEKRGLPLAKWQGDENTWGGAHLNRQRRRSQCETMSEDGGGRDDTEHSLTFDAESRKLAFALGNQVRFLSFFLRFTQIFHHLLCL
jgi:WD40 repeat protein